MGRVLISTMFGCVLRRCAFVGVRACPPASWSVGFSPLALSTVRSAGTVSGKGTRDSIGIADFLIEAGMPEKAATQVACTRLQNRTLSEMRTNYDGLVAVLGTEAALEAIPRTYSLLETPPETTFGAHAALVELLGADGAADFILTNPSVLKSPGKTIKSAHQALVELLGAGGAADAILQSPAVLQSPAETMKGAHRTLVSTLGANRAAEAILTNPNVLRSRVVTIKGNHEALVDILGADGAAAAIRENPEVLRSLGDTIKGAQGNFETMCNAFDRKLVLKAVRVRPTLLYDRTAANKAVETGMLPPG